MIINHDKAENEKAKKKINPADHLVELLNMDNPLSASSAILFLLSFIRIITQTMVTKGIKKNKEVLFNNHDLLSKILS
ncbi:MAG: hypothetical protein EBR72_03780 [Bacteroidetes bacterium]|nr:hypothetical protein [Bacteroidota bacterium]